MKKIMPLLFFVCSLINYAQTPCDNGMAGSYPCNGYDLQSFIPFQHLMLQAEMILGVGPTPKMAKNMP